MATTEPPGDAFEVHVFGGSEGESIVLRLPGSRYGVVDCFARSISDPSTNATRQFLRSRSVTALEFLCLTHAHTDHFRCMSQLLEEFDVRSFWRPAVMDGERLRKIILSRRIDAERSDVSEAIENATELGQIFKLVASRARRRTAPLVEKRALLDQPLYPSPFDSQADVRIWAIAPCPSELDAYEQSLSRCFDMTGQLIEPLPSLAENRVSIALLIEYGATRIVLGGDVEAANWRQTLTQFDNSRLAAHFVKISHHGSRTGYCERLWECHARTGRPTTVLTPFEKHGLPERAALEHISRVADRITTPCRAATEFAADAPRTLGARNLESQLTLRAEMKLRPRRQVPTGQCSFRFDNKGNCLLVDLGEHGGDVRAPSRA